MEACFCFELGVPLFMNDAKCDADDNDDDDDAGDFGVEFPELMARIILLSVPPSGIPEVTTMSGFFVGIFAGSIPRSTWSIQLSSAKRLKPRVRKKNHEKIW